MQLLFSSVLFHLFMSKSCPKLIHAGFCGLFAALIARCQLRRGKLLLRLMPRHVLGASGCSGCSTEIFSGISQHGKAQKPRQKQRRSFESLKSSSLCLSLPPAKESHRYILGRLSRNLNGSVFEGFFGRIEALKCLAVETTATLETSKWYSKIEKSNSDLPRKLPWL